MVALIVPDFPNLESYAAYKNISFQDRKDLASNAQVRDLIRRRIEYHQRHAASYETIKKFTLLDHELSVEANELTPTLKVKRKTISSRYAKEIEALYAESNAPDGQNGT